MPWGKRLHTTWNRLLNLRDQPCCLQRTRRLLPCWHGKRGCKQASHDWQVKMSWKTCENHPQSKWCTTSASETSVQAGNTVQASTWSSLLNNYHEQGLLFPSTPKTMQAPFPTCCDHSTVIQAKRLDYFNALSTPLHLQNIQPEASTACCSLTGWTLGAI